MFNKALYSFEMHDLCSSWVYDDQKPDLLMAFRHKDGIMLVSNINWNNERRTGITEGNLRTSYGMLPMPDDSTFFARMIIFSTSRVLIF